MAAGLAMLNEISQPGFYETLTQRTEQLVTGITTAAAEHGIALQSNQVGSMFGLFFTDSAPVTRYQQVVDCDMERFRQFYHGMLDQGVYLAPSAFEAGFVSSKHDETTINDTIEAARRVLEKISQG